jgi:hypothetical protein|uniref:Uncharacterized protein n=1 Tax=Eutreptiella gymnastica TaxID=73025 RepID=A0A7S4C7B7_9EUGL
MAELPEMNEKAFVASRMEDGAGLADGIRRMSTTTATFSNHQGVDEFKRCKDEFMSRLRETNTDFEDIIEGRQQLVDRLSLSTFIQSTMATLNRGGNGTMGRIQAAGTPPPLSYSPNSKALVTRRPHSIEPLSKHRMKVMNSRLPNINVDFAGSGKMNSSMVHRAQRALVAHNAKQKEMVTVTGKVDYQQLRAEQKALNAKTEAADVQYKAMLNEFEQFKEDVNRRFSFLLQDSTRMITAFDDDPHHQGLLVNVPDNIWTKVDTTNVSGEATDAIDMSMPE